jgi:hypothetical protein
MKYGKRLLGLAGVLAATGAVALSALPAASAAPAHVRPAISGIEHFRLMSTTGDTNHSPVIATGLFTAGGRDHVVSNNTDKFVFPKGTITVRHSNSKGPQSFNPRTCLLRVNQHGTYRILRGTGAYTGITGHGRYRLTILAVGARGANGKCTQKKPPVAIELEIRARGPVSL